MIYIYISWFLSTFFFSILSGDTWHLSNGYWCVVWFGGACELSAPPSYEEFAFGDGLRWMSWNVREFCYISLEFLGLQNYGLFHPFFFHVSLGHKYRKPWGDWWTIVKLRCLKLLMVKRRSDMEHTPFAEGFHTFQLVQDFFHQYIRRRSRWFASIECTESAYFFKLQLLLRPQITPPYSTLSMIFSARSVARKPKRQNSNAVWRLKRMPSNVVCNLVRVKMPSLLVFGEGCKLVELDVG